MTRDYKSVFAALPAKHGRRIFEKLSPHQKLGVLVGPNDITVTEFAAQKPLDRDRIANTFKGRIPRVDSIEGASVEVSADLLDDLEANASKFETLTTSQIAVLSALDRVLAVPHGVPFLDGQAVALLTRADQAKIGTEFNHLLDRLGGPEVAAEIVGPYLDAQGSGVDDVLEAIDTLNETLETAEKKKLDVLLLCCPDE